MSGPPEAAAPGGFQDPSTIARIVELADALTSHRDPEVQALATELLDAVDAWHRCALLRLLEIARAWRGDHFLTALSTDPATGELLEAYGLAAVEGELPEHHQGPVRSPDGGSQGSPEPVSAPVRRGCHQGLAPGSGVPAPVAVRLTRKRR